MSAKIAWAIILLLSVPVAALMIISTAIGYIAMVAFGVVAIYLFTSNKTEQTRIKQNRALFVAVHTLRNGNYENVKAEFNKRF